MSTYLADNYTDPMPEVSSVGVTVCREFLFTVATALALNDIIKLCPFAKGMAVVLTDWFIDFPDLDSGGTAIRVQFGDSSTADKFLAASDIGTAAVKRYMKADGVAQSVPVEYAAGADKDLRLTVSTGPTGGATGVAIRGWVKYHFSGIASPV